MDPKCNHKCPYKRKVEGDLTEGGNETTEAKCYVIGFEDVASIRK